MDHKASKNMKLYFKVIIFFIETWKLTENKIK